MNCFSLECLTPLMHACRNEAKIERNQKNTDKLKWLINKMCPSRVIPANRLLSCVIPCTIASPFQTQIQPLPPLAAALAWWSPCSNYTLLRSNKDRTYYFAPQITHRAHTQIFMTNERDLNFRFRFQSL